MLQVFSSNREPIVGCTSRYRYGYTNRRGSVLDMRVRLVHNLTNEDVNKTRIDEVRVTGTGLCDDAIAERFSSHGSIPRPVGSPKSDVKFIKNRRQKTTKEPALTNKLLL